jgi:hypothetical protein
VFGNRQLTSTALDNPKRRDNLPSHRVAAIPKSLGATSNAVDMTDRVEGQLHEVNE